MHTCMLYVQRLLASEIFGHYLHTCTGSHQNVYYMYIKYHSMKMVSGSISQHKYHTYIICPLHVYDEAGGHVPTLQRLCYK